MGGKRTTNMETRVNVTTSATVVGLMAIPLKIAKSFQNQNKKERNYRTLRGVRNVQDMLEKIEDLVDIGSSHINVKHVMNGTMNGYV